MTQLPEGFPTGGRVLVSDFDGTMTHYDFFERVRARFPVDESVDGWSRYVAGEVTHFEALRETYARVPCDEALALEIAREARLDPQLHESLARLRDAGWSVVVVSAGCNWYIERLLADQGVTLPVITNPAELKPEGLTMSLPVGSPFFSAEVGVDKLAVVRTLIEICDEVAFAGDGRPDFPPARLVAPSRRFARGWLADALRAEGLPFHPFERWSEIAETLLRS